MPAGSLEWPWQPGGAARGMRGLQGGAKLGLMRAEQRALAVTADAVQRGISVGTSDGSFNQRQELAVVNQVPGGGCGSLSPANGQLLDSVSQAYFKEAPAKGRWFGQKNISSA